VVCALYTHYNAESGKVNKSRLYSFKTSKSQGTKNKETGKGGEAGRGKEGGENVTLIIRRGRLEEEGQKNLSPPDVTGQMETRKEHRGRAPGQKGLIRRPCI